MRYRKLSSDGDYTFGQGLSNFYIDVPAAVGQAVQTRLLLQEGEWFLDITEGTPYDTDILGANKQATRDLAIKTVTLQTQGVLGLIQYSSQLDANRKFTVQEEIQTIYGTTTVEVAQ